MWIGRVVLGRAWRRWVTPGAPAGIVSTGLWGCVLGDGPGEAGPGSVAEAAAAGVRAAAVAVRVRSLSAGPSRVYPVVG